MKKRTWISIVMALVLATGCIAAAHAELLPADGEGQIGLTGVVLCESLTVHQSASQGAKVVKTLENGQMVIVMKQEDGWAQISISDDVNGGPLGWVKADYLAVDPAWFLTDSETHVYAWGSLQANKVALIEAGTRLPVLMQDGDWIVVGLRGAAGWICLEK